jgi:hypothetical protein
VGHAGGEQPQIDEDLHPDDGYWITRRKLYKHPNDPLKNRGDHYFHSSFCDLVITGLVGVRVPASATQRMLVVSPLLPVRLTPPWPTQRTLVVSPLLPVRLTPPWPTQRTLVVSPLLPVRLTPHWPTRAILLGLESRPSKADPRQQQDWILKCQQGRRAHPLAACGVAVLCCSPFPPRCWKPFT